MRNIKYYSVVTLSRRRLNVNCSIAVLLQSRQKCICDTEHMFNCPDAENEAEEDNELDNELPRVS